MITLTLPIPSAFQPKGWTDEGPRRWYSGLGFEITKKYLQVDADDNSQVKLCGYKLQVQNPQFAELADGYPIYFEVTGRNHHYVVTIWSNCVMIDICDANNDYEVVKTWEPQSEKMLQVYLRQIACDYGLFQLQLRRQSLLTV